MTPGSRNTKNGTLTHHTLRSQHAAEIHGVDDGANTVVTEIQSGTPVVVPQQDKGVLGKLAGRLSRTSHRETGHHTQSSVSRSMGSRNRSEHDVIELQERPNLGGRPGSRGEGITVSYEVTRTVEEVPKALPKDSKM